MTFLFVGDRVKKSEFALRPHREYYYQCMEHRVREGARRSLIEHEEMRGTVMDVHKWGVEVDLDTGGTCSSILGYWERV